MNSYLFGRALGTVSPQALQRAHSAELLNAIHPAPGIGFDGSDRRRYDDKHNEAGVNCVAIDKFEGR